MIVKVVPAREAVISSTIAAHMGAIEFLADMNRVIVSLQTRESFECPQAFYTTDFTSANSSASTTTGI